VTEELHAPQSMAGERSTQGVPERTSSPSLPSQ
jgi:hypothetical protein